MVKENEQLKLYNLNKKKKIEKNFGFKMPEFIYF